MIVLLIVPVALLYLYITFRLGLWYWRGSRSHPPIGQVVGRTIAMPIFWGVGVLGGEGFALPGPLVLVTVFPKLTNSLSPISAQELALLATEWLVNLGFFLVVSLVAAWNYSRPWKRGRTQTGNCLTIS
jgi:hypothetical protein